MKLIIILYTAMQLDAKKITQIKFPSRFYTLGIDFDQSDISKIENQKKVLLDFEVKAVAQVLGIPIEKLFD